MSIFKKIRLDETINRDSFEDRIWDDLCEEILQWLNPIEKLTMAGVSKQFKRCLEPVRKRQKALRFNRGNDSETINANNAVDLRLISKKIPKVIKFYPNIETIDLTDLSFWAPLIVSPFRGFFEAVMSCEKLKSIIGYRIYDFLGEEKLKQFIEKFDKQWRYLDLDLATTGGLELFRICKSIKNLDIQFFNLIDGNQVFASNLEYATIHAISNTNLFEKFVLQNPNLKSLTLYNSVNTTNILRHIAKLTKLKVLKIKIYIDDKNASEVSKHFTAIAMKTELRSLFLHISCEIEINEFLAKSLTSFTTLQHIFLKINGRSENDIKFILTFWQEIEI